MGNLKSTLTMQLINGVSGPAARVRQDLKTLDAAARKAQGNRLIGGPAGAGGATVLAGGGRLLLGAAGLAIGAGATRAV